MALTLKVNYKNVDEAARGLQQLSSTIRARDLSVSFSRSEGEVVEAMIEIAATTKELGEAIANFIDSCAVVVAGAGTEFENAEALIQKIFESITAVIGAVTQ